MMGTTDIPQKGNINYWIEQYKFNELYFWDISTRMDKDFLDTIEKITKSDSLDHLSSYKATPELYKNQYTIALL